MAHITMAEMSMVPMHSSRDLVAVCFCWSQDGKAGREGREGGREKKQGGLWSYVHLCDLSVDIQLVVRSLE